MKSKLDFLQAAARRLRRDQTDAEAVLWRRLRRRELLGVKFRRQHRIDGCVVDFCAPQIGLVVELDGGQHAALQEKAAERTAQLERRGYRVLRFWNTDVLNETAAVLETIAEAIVEKIGEIQPRRIAPGSSPPRRAGAQSSRSSTVEMPMPAPMHWVARP